MYVSKAPMRSLMVLSSLLHASVLAFTASNNPNNRPTALPRETALRGTSPSFDDEFVDMQKKVGESSDGVEVESLPSPLPSAVEGHLVHQREVFDEMSAFFDTEDATPEEVKPVLRALTRKILAGIKTTGANEDGKFDVLDVGCGTGALFPYYLEAADDLGMELNIVGLDLSPRMVEMANRNAIELVAAAGDSKHSIRCICGDFVERVMGVNSVEETLTGFGDGVLDENTEKLREKFGAVVINACFGNFLNQDHVVTAAARALKNGGSFVISHPLGSEFVAKLRSENPSTVPNLLPTESELEGLLRFQPLVKADFAGGIEAPAGAAGAYYARSEKVPHAALREVLRLRGPVDMGYGRGGKKLGFPTANLPSSLFADCLADVPAGVYLGWAVVEGAPDDDGDVPRGRDAVHKAVVNVGYSPTFEGKENGEKIVEAHLIVGGDDVEGDFYGETMRLALRGFLRPERRFPSFPDLIAAITNDVSNAKELLDSGPYSEFSEDGFLKVDRDEKWVGSSGGDDNASFEFGS